MKKTAFILSIILLTGFTAAQTSVELDVSLKKTEPVPLQSSEYADVWLEVTNRGDNEADNVELSFQENYPFSADPDERTQWDLGTLKPSEEYQVHLQTRVDENAVQGNNTINFETSSSTGISIQHKVPVEVRSDNAILSVEKTYFPETVRPGSSNQLTFRLRNMADSQLKNIEVGVDASDGSLPMAASGSSKLNIQKISPDSARNVTYTLNLDESAENGVYKLPLNLEYENEAGTSFSTTTTTGIVVGGMPELQIGINNDEQLRSGTSQPVNFRIVNRGYGSAEFVELVVPNSGDNFRTLSPNTVYIGQMDPDDFQTAEFQIYFESENVTVPAKLNYRDATGEVTETRQIQLDVYSQQDLQRYGLAQNNNTLVIVSVVLALLTGALIYWRRRKRKKK